MLRGIGLNDALGRYALIARDKLFDLKHGVNTGGIIQLRDLSIASPNAAFGCYYEGFDPKLFNKILGEMEIKHENFVFVDFGSGKGRVLLLASEYPFKKIVGVEFSPELNRIAQNNIRKYRSASRKCRDVESVCQDAVSYSIPKEPAVLFLANPFGEEVMSPALANIQKSLEESPREIFIIYAHPRLDHLMERNQALTKIASGPWHSIYKGVRGNQ